MVYRSGRRDCLLSEAACESWMCAELPGLKPGSSAEPKFGLSCLWVLLDLTAEAAEMLHGTGQHRAGKWGFLSKILGGWSTWVWVFQLLVLTGPLLQIQIYLPRH